MTVEDLLKNGFGAVATPETDREITGVYIGDLLSWVMGRAQSGDAWITIMSNINVPAVASLTDVSCVILAEGVELDDDALAAAKVKDVCVLRSPLPVYETSVVVSKAIE